MAAAAPSVGPVGILGPLELHLETLHADLEPVHGLDRSLRRCWVVKTHKPCKKGKTRKRQREPSATNLRRFATNSLYVGDIYCYPNKVMLVDTHIRCQQASQ